MHWLTVAPDFTRMTLVLLWFSFFFDMYNGAMVAALVMPVYVRTVGFRWPSALPPRSSAD